MLLAFLLGSALAVSVTCPPPAASEMLQGLVRGRAENDPKKRSYYNVHAEKVDDRTDVSVAVSWIIKPNGEGGSSVELANVSPPTSGRGAVAAGERTSSWSGEMVRYLELECRRTDWSAKQATMGFSTFTEDVSSHTCAMMGGEMALFTSNGKFYIGASMTGSPTRITYSTPRFELEGNGLQVNYCVRKPDFHGPLIVKSVTGAKLFAAFYVDGKLHGKIVQWDEKSAYPLVRAEAKRGMLVGEALYFDKSGSPMQFLVYSTDGEVLGCSGRCKEKFSDRHYIGPSEYSNYKSLDFLAHMEDVRLQEESEIARKKAEGERWRLEIEAADAARLARSKAAGADKARNAAFSKISNGCVNVRLGVSGLSYNGWFRIEGTAACPERNEFLNQTLLVKKQISLALSVNESGDWVTLGGVSYNDL